VLPMAAGETLGIAGLNTWGMYDGLSLGNVGQGTLELPDCASARAKVAPIQVGARVAPRLLGLSAGIAGLFANKGTAGVGIAGLIAPAFPL